MEQQIFNFPTPFLSELSGLGLDVNTLFILDAINRGDTEFPPKYIACLQTLQRKSYIDELNTITETGKQLLLSIEQGNKDLKREKKEQTIKTMDKFDEWWAAYPPGDTFIHNNKTFKGTRAFKKNKTECKKKFLAIVATGNYTADELIEAIKLDVEQRKEASVKRNKNELTYFQSTEPYLNQGTYEGFVEMIRKNQVKKEVAPITFSI